MNMKYAMRSEDTEQINVVSCANWNVNRYLELRWLFHVPNGGSRNKQEAQIRNARLDTHLFEFNCLLLFLLPPFGTWNNHLNSG